MVSIIRRLAVHVHLSLLRVTVKGLAARVQLAVKANYVEPCTTTSGFMQLHDHERQGRLLTDGRNYAWWLRLIQIRAMHEQGFYMAQRFSS